MRFGLIVILLLFVAGPFCIGKPAANVQELLSAVANEPEGSEIAVGKGIFILEEPLVLKEGTKLKGAGIGETILVASENWKTGNFALPGGELRPKKDEENCYLIRLANKGKDISISHMTLRGPQVHGAIFGNGNENLHLHHLRVEDVLWSGIRTFGMKNAKVHNCDFIDAGGKWKKGGLPGHDGGVSGGAIFVTWAIDSEIWNNRFTKTIEGKARNVFGIKGRGGRRCHIHHNTIGVNFSIEFPFEGNEDFEIDHNICHGVISIPKHEGGKVPESGVTFHIHHNYFTTGYAVEFPRNGVEISHNLFDFTVDKDGGNAICGFAKSPAPGPFLFHNNLVNNPGRGVLWNHGIYNQVTIRNNHIIARETVTPRKEGLFGIHGGSDFDTIRLVENIIECRGLARPLFRNENSYGATVKGNELINVSDTEKYENPASDKKAGLEKPLLFKCGVNGEMTVNGWEIGPTKSVAAAE